MVPLTRQKCPLSDYESGHPAFRHKESSSSAIHALDEATMHMLSRDMPVAIAIDYRRNKRIAPEPASSKHPSEKTSGSSLPVFGKACGASSTAGAGTGAADAIRIGASGAGGGGGGILPASSFCSVTTVRGSSTTFVAETTMPFFRPHTSVSC